MEKVISEAPKVVTLSERVTLWVGSPASLVLHTILFAVVLSLPFFGFPLEKALLILTTAVSLEAIYLALFIQMSINRNTAQLAAVEEDIEDIQEDVEEIGEDVEEMQKDVEEISEDIEEITEDVEEMQKDVEEISEDLEEITEDVEGIEKNVKEISEDVEEIQEDVAELEDATDEDKAREELAEKDEVDRIAKIETLLAELKRELLSMKK